MRLLTAVVVTSLVSSALTALALHATDGAAAEPASHRSCGQPRGATWLCSGDGFYVPRADWSCGADSPTGAALPTVLFCHRMSNGKQIAWIQLSNDRVRVGTGTRPTLTTTGRLEYVFRVPR